jgi:hypothetical protein
MFTLIDRVALTHDIAPAGLRRGDLGAIVELVGTAHSKLSLSLDLAEHKLC